MMMYKNRYSQSGFSLLELLLTVGVLSILFASGASVFDKWQKDTVDRKVAREMQELQNAAERYVGLNINVVRAALPTVGDSVEIPLDDLRTGAFLPPAYSGLNSYRQSMRVFVRYDSATSSRGDVFEVITVSDNVGGGNNRVADRRLFNAATSGQRSVGIISNVAISATCCNGNIQSAYGGWSIPLANIPAYTTTPGVDGGYMAAYGRVFTDELLTGNYLYRFDVPDIPNGNRMEVDLDITSNDIENAGAIVADHVTGTSATVRGDAFSRLPGTYNLMADDDLTANTMAVSWGGNEQKGNLSVEGTGTGTAFTVNGSVTVLNAATGAGNVAADNLDTNAATVSGESNFSFVDNTGSNATGGIIYVNAATYDQSLSIANDLQARTIENFDSTASASLVSGNIVSAGTINVAGDVQADNNMNIQGVATAGNNGPGGILGTSRVTIGTLVCNDPDLEDCPYE